MTGDWTIVLVLGIPFAAVWWAGRRSRQRRQAAAATVELVVDDWGVRRRLADGRAEEVSWPELVEVELATLPPRFPERTKYVLSGTGERGCLVPESMAAEHRLVEHLARLPGFDARRLGELLDKQAPGRHQVWARASDGQPA